MKILFSAWIARRAALGVVCACAAVAGTEGRAQELEVLHVQGNVYLVAGPGGNTTAQVGPDGLFLVDSKFAPLAEPMLDALRPLGDGPLRYVVNTHMHADHTGGNARLRQRAPGTNLEPFSIIAHLNALTRMVALEREDPDAVPEGGLPLASYDVGSRDLHFNGEPIFIYHEPNAHTDGDSIVLFRGSNVVSTGDVFVPGSYPFIDLEGGGSVRGLVDALNHILELAVPAKTQEGGTYVVPGHGRICDEADVVEYRDMVVIVSERIADMIDRGLSLRQIQRERPTRDYDTEFVDDDSFVTAEQFVEAVYRSLAGERE
jgi:glyoxylase-like metal-dependent hydrolase (beta-lactamase superfamily II)